MALRTSSALALLKAGTVEMREDNTRLFPVESEWVKGRIAAFVFKAAATCRDEDDWPERAAPRGLSAGAEGQLKSAVAGGLS